MRRFLIVLCFTCLAFYLYPQPAFAQDLITDTVTVDIDGVQRTVVVSYTMTGVVALEVAPITSTFETTATAWLEDLWATTDGFGPGAEIDAQQRYSDTRVLLEQTETVPYPTYFKPFVRQYRFAIHICTAFIQMAGSIQADEESATIFAVAPFLIMRNACAERYQDAYVEMERIVADEIENRRR
jgi:hypothetical protein